MSLVIATPCYGNTVTAAYLRSLVRFAREAPVDWDLMVPTKNDSLIQRARNLCVRVFLETRYDWLMFIDADIEFTTDDVARIWNIDGQVKGGIYPMKRADKDWYAAWVDGKLTQDLDSLPNPVECDYLGTGFLMVHRDVFTRMQDERPELNHAESDWEDNHCWFNPRVIDDGHGPFYASEDFAFCYDARQLGYKIFADPTVRLLHHGSYAYGSSGKNGN